MSIRKPSIPSPRSAQSVLLSAIIESLEARQLLSGDNPLINSPTAGAYTPTQVRTAYGINALNIANQGQGVTIAIVDEFDDTKITADANAFSAEYGLPLLDGLSGDPTLTVTKDTTLGTVASAAGTGVGGETSLDVEWAHAMAPKANILLEEVPATGSVTNEFLELVQGVQAAAATSGVVAVSLSYGYAEASIGASSVVSQNNTYLAAGAAANIAVTVSTGDGSSPLYPATSPNVVAVGGTSLYLNSLKGAYGFETAWGGLSGAGAGGGGLSTNFAAPTFQSGNGVNFAKRSIPDVSLVADPVTAVSIYDSLDSSTAPWTSTGGTSVASPIFAGMLGLAQQNRLTAGLSLLTSVQIDTAMYKAYNSASYSTYFNDIKLGNNKDGSVAGFSAATGYDQATGIGSPIASTLIPMLSAYVPAPVQNVRLGGGLGTANSRIGSASTSASESDTTDSSTVYDLLPSSTGKTITPGFAKAVAEAQLSPVISAAPSIDSIEVSTATHSLYSPNTLAGNNGFGSGELGLAAGFLDNFGDTIVASVA